MLTPNRFYSVQESSSFKQQRETRRGMFVQTDNLGIRMMPFSQCRVESTPVLYVSGLFKLAEKHDERWSLKVTPSPRQSEREHVKKRWKE